MAITHMYGFDQLDVGPNSNIGDTAWRNLLANEGFALKSTCDGSGSVWVTPLLGRNWFYSQVGGGAAGGSSIVYNTVADWFGAGVKKKGWIGFRFYQAAITSDGFVAVATLGGTNILGSYELQVGTCYVEFEIDFEAKTVRRFIDGVQLGNPITVNIADTNNINLGFQCLRAYTAGGAGFITDIYAVNDTQDDTPCQRLGSVRVLPIEVDAVTMPNDWTEIERDNGNSMLIDGVLHKRPYLSTPLMPDRGQEISAFGPSGLRNGAATYNWYTPVSQITFYNYNISPSTPNGFTMKLPKPTKITAYTVRRTSDANVFYADAWTLQGSQNGTNWTTLDTRSGVGPTLQANKNAFIPFKVPTVNQAEYLYYRISVTARLSEGAAQYFEFGGWQLFVPATEDLATPVEILNAKFAYNASDNTAVTGVLKTSIDETQAVISHKRPAVTTEKILKVQLRMTAVREGGSEVRLITNHRQGGAVSPDLTTTLNAAYRYGVVVLDAHKAADGTAWTADKIDQIELLVKSKSGAA